MYIILPVNFSHKIFVLCRMKFFKHEKFDMIQDKATHLLQISYINQENIFNRPCYKPEGVCNDQSISCA